MTTIRFLKILILVIVALAVTDILGKHFFKGYIDIRHFSFSKQYRLNDAGIREDLSMEKLKEVPDEKIVVMGNSVVLGFREPSVQKTLTGFMQSFASERHLTTKFINAGINGGTYRTEFPLLKEKLLLLPNIKQVIWVVGANDFEDPRETSDFENNNDLSSPKKPEKKYRFTFFRDLSLFLFLRLNLFISDYNFNSDYDLHATEFLLKERPPGNVVQLADEVKKLRDYLAEKNISLQVIFVPPRKFNKEFLWADARPFNELTAELQKSGVPAAHFFNEFKAGCQDCFIDSEHLNEKGNRFLAQLLFNLTQSKK